MLLIDLLFLSAGVFTIYLGLRVAVLGGAQVVYKTFPFFAINLGFWAVSLVLLSETQDAFFEKTALLFSLLGIAALPLFMYTFPRFSWPRWWFWLMYLPLLPLVAALPTARIVASVTFSDGAAIPDTGPLFLVYVAAVAWYLLVTLCIYLYRYSTLQGSDRLRAQYIGLGLVTFVLLGLIAVVILPYFGNFSYLFTAPMSAFLVLLSLTAVAVMRQELIDIQIVVVEICVFLAAGIVLLNNLFRATGSIELITGGFLLAVFLFTGVRLFSLLMSIFHQRQALKAANEKLSELMEMKTEFLQIASHQLRAPLTSLRGLVQMEASGYFNDLPEEKRTQLRQQMLISVDRLHELVNDLLRALRLEGEKLPFTFAPVDMLALAQEVVKTLEHNYIHRHLYLTVKKPARSLPMLQGDKEYLRQVLINLVDNAEKYTQQGGTTITLQQEAHSIVMEVIDTGIGITPEETEGLFEKFNRSQRARSLREEGTGLGLFIAKKIVESHQGKIEVISGGVNKGTTFKVVLPLKQQPTEETGK
jgi:signal transduction histidine kinase